MELLAWELRRPNGVTWGLLIIGGSCGDEGDLPMTKMSLDRGCHVARNCPRPSPPGPARVSRSRPASAAAGISVGGNELLPAGHAACIYLLGKKIFVTRIRL